MKQIFILAGCNGCGKTTLYQSSFIPKNIPYLNFDRIFFDNTNVLRIFSLYNKNKLLYALSEKPS